MNLIRRIAQRDPSGALTVVNLAAGAIAALVGHPEFTPVFVAVAGLVLGLRTQVTPVDKAKATAVEAARDAAVQVASNLNSHTAGPIGEITDDARAVIDDTVGLVAGILGGKP